jgi:hypothetical protein
MGEDIPGKPLNRYAPYKSWGESRIAGLLDQYGLPFIYEKPTAVVDSGQVRIWYPDFTLPYGLLIEYFGITGDAQYDLRTQHKRRVYGNNQFDVLPVYRNDLARGGDDNLLGRIDRTLESRLNGYRSAIGGRYLRSPSSLRPGGRYRLR